MSELACHLTTTHGLVHAMSGVDLGSGLDIPWPALQDGVSVLSREV